MKQKLVLFLKILIVVFAIIGLVSVFPKNTSPPEIQNLEEAQKEKLVDCLVASDLGDLNKDGRSEYVIFCGEEIYVSAWPTESVIGYQKLENKQSFYDLFYFKGPLTNPTVKVIRVFPKANPQFFAIVSIFDSGGTYKEAFGIYRVKGFDEENGLDVERVFTYSFGDAKGRWTGMNVSEVDASFRFDGDLGQIGCGGCRIEWIDFYRWDGQAFAIDNATHITAFKDLLSKYEEQDKKGCELAIYPTNDNSHKGLSFTELYEKFPDVKTYCPSSVGGISKETVVTFLDAMKTIKEIIEGKNFTYGEK